MGISNVVTGASGALAAAIGLVIVDIGNHIEFGLGPRLAFGIACAYYVIGALLLTRVDEHRREDPVVAPAAPEPDIGVVAPAG